MSPVAMVLLAAAVALVAVAEWPRLGVRIGRPPQPRRTRRRRRRQTDLRVVHPESEEFARAVERDLAELPTIDERDMRRH